MSHSEPPRPNVSDVLFGETLTGSKEEFGNWRHSFPEIIGSSAPLLEVLETVSKVARSDSSVLICGESGTGKELIAAAIHRLSLRSGRRFVPINCSAIPENLLESELFGHEKGAFTGAVARRPGHFEMADGGTIFLDEIGDMPQRLQAKLLRVLQEKQFTSVGGHQLKKANVRVVAATNIELNKAVQAGQFRLDLYYRLNVLPVNLPPLRERVEDITHLLDHFIEKVNGLHPYQKDCYFAPATIARLKEYSWPGNVRELQNLIERLVVLTRGGEILPEHLPIDIDAAETNTDERASQPTETLSTIPGRQVAYPKSFGDLPDAGINLSKYVEELENKLILQALDRTGNNKNRAAQLLGLNRTTLVERIKKRKIGSNS